VILGEGRKGKTSLRGERALGKERKGIERKERKKFLVAGEGRRRLIIGKKGRGLLGTEEGGKTKAERNKLSFGKKSRSKGSRAVERSAKGG